MQQRTRMSAKRLDSDCKCRTRLCSRCSMHRKCERDFCATCRLYNPWRLHRKLRSHRCQICLQMCTRRCLGILQISRRMHLSTQSSTRSACMGCLSSDQTVHVPAGRLRMLWDAWYLHNIDGMLIPYLHCYHRCIIVCLDADSICKHLLWPLKHLGARHPGSDG